LLGSTLAACKQAKPPQPSRPDVKSPAGKGTAAPPPPSTIEELPADLVTEALKSDSFEALGARLRPHLRLCVLDHAGWTDRINARAGGTASRQILRAYLDLMTEARLAHYFPEAVGKPQYNAFLGQSLFADPNAGEQIRGPRGGIFSRITLPALPTDPQDYLRAVVGSPDLVAPARMAQVARLIQYSSGRVKWHEFAHALDPRQLIVPPENARGQKMLLHNQLESRALGVEMLHLLQASGDLDLVQLAVDLVTLSTFVGATRFVHNDRTKERECDALHYFAPTLYEGVAGRKRHLRGELAALTPEGVIHHGAVIGDSAASSFKVLQEATLAFSHARMVIMKPPPFQKRLLDGVTWYSEPANEDGTVEPPEPGSVERAVHNGTLNGTRLCVQQLLASERRLLNR
jgi:hypothetical protein